MVTTPGNAIDGKDFVFLTEANSRQWLDAVLMQGERCVTAVNLLRSADGIEQFRHASNMMRIEEHFFVIALGKAMEWLAELAKQSDEFRPEIEGYLAQMPHARDVRNMREHDIAYFKGEGNRHSRFVHQHTDSDGHVLAISDATSTAVFGEQYLIGGRLDLNIVVSISQKLRLTLGDINFFAAA
jgi:hypothetical protein